MRDRGHDVVFAISKHYQSKIESLGFEFHSLRPDSISPEDEEAIAMMMDLNGGYENDELYGGAHEDTLFGDEGDDTLSGGKDSDTFVLGDRNYVYYRGGEDSDYALITDFSSKADKI